MSTSYWDLGVESKIRYFTFITVSLFMTTIRSFCRGSLTLTVAA